VDHQRLAELLNSHIRKVIGDETVLRQLSFELSTNAEGTMLSEWKIGNRCLGIGYKDIPTDSFWYYYTLDGDRPIALHGNLSSLPFDTIIGNLC